MEAKRSALDEIATRKRTADAKRNEEGQWQLRRIVQSAMVQ
jgi:hypothetical protein